MKFTNYDDFLNEGLTPEEKAAAKVESLEKKQEIDKAANWKPGDKLVLKDRTIHYFKWKREGDSRFKTQNQLDTYEIKQIKNLTVVGIHYGESGGYKSDGVWKSINPSYICSYTKYEQNYQCILREENARLESDEKDTMKAFDLLVEAVVKKVGCEKYEIKKRDNEVESVTMEKYFVKMNRNPTLNMNSYYGHDSNNRRGRTSHLSDLALGDFFRREDAENFAEEAKKLYGKFKTCRDELYESGKPLTVEVGPEKDEKYSRHEYVLSKESFIELAKRTIDIKQFLIDNRGTVSGKDLGIL